MRVNAFSPRDGGTWVILPSPIDVDESELPATADSLKAHALAHLLPRYKITDRWDALNGMTIRNGERLETTPPWANGTAG
jgi:hypothetical protein